MLISRCSPGVIASWTVTQYAILLNMINKRFESINLGILKMGGNIRSGGTQSQTLSVTKLSLLRELVLYDIDNIKYAYVELCEICQDIGDFYGLSILIVILHFGFQSIFVLYFAISSLIQGHEHSMTMHLFNGVRLSLSTFLFTVLTSSVTNTIKESKKISNIINLLMDRCPMDQKIKEQLFRFSHHLLHLKVEFSACDIVPLDRTFLAIIVGTIATYLIIILQFRISASN
ncbi:putative gustatory receptor 28b [Microplitis mediator]|uniref:putative gustatory receptor 28b n=1 Tax=Microplitis mediator TaxID=375433 RepID=UPI002557C066|nr:putative gustatory receptor 28b [Microplitis mediator]